MTDTEQWAEAAHEILVEVAGRYHGLIEYGELGAEVQRRSEIATRTPTRNWIGPVLGLVAERCHRDGTPPLTALVIRKDTGMVGDLYDTTLAAVGAPLPDDPMQREKQAAEHRLECYRWAGAELPSHGGRAVLAPRLAAREATRLRRNPAPIPVCPRCQMALLPTGVCDACG